ncbi:Cysteine/Histidine-rich C1 domain family protein [Abeliophyllum distichum]|uniref:Cysteine/Histidine-rich C1 domain family protein n=1 Tax=Abeliophyllum distichum TaxID=126358 RepID=A0ABD1RT07_9LAMI
MEFKHFSHNHGLVFHQLPQGTEIHCSGCKTVASGLVYACWQCRYFLHEQCFQATRSFKHPSHPLHPLTLVPYPTHPSSSFFCDSCNILGNGFCYCCSECDFDLHVHCAYNSATPPVNFPNFAVETQNFNPHAAPNMPQNSTHPTIQNSPYPNSPFPNPSVQNQAQNFNNLHAPIQNNHIPVFTPTNPTVPNFSPPVSVGNMNPTPPASQAVHVQQPQTKPKVIKHFSHPHILQPTEIKEKNTKVCSACECDLFGSAYCCIEPHCNFNLHKACFESPMEVRHKCHLDHPLKLLPAPPYNDGFTCNACLKDGKAFCYTCSTCSYDLHIDCISWPETMTRVDHKHPLTLYYSPVANAGEGNQVTFMCDVCKSPVHELAWLYYCRECDFGTHLECVTSGLKQNPNAPKTDEELIRETELKMAVLQILLNGGLATT